MTENEFDLKLEESGFRYTDISRAKEYKINGYAYRIRMPLLNSKLRAGISIVKFNKTWGIDNSLLLLPSSSNKDNGNFYSDCIVCFNLIDLIFEEMKKESIYKLNLMYDLFEFCHFDSGVFGITKTTLSFDNENCMFNYSLGFAFYVR